MKIARPHIPNRSAQKGSILIICITLAALGSLGIAAFISVLQARSAQVESNFDALDRRVALQNAQTLTRQVIQTSLLANPSGTIEPIHLTLPNDKGSVSFEYSGPPPLSNNILGPFSGNNATPNLSHSVNLPVTLSDGVGSSEWIFRLRNQNPVLGGELLTIYAPVHPTDTTPLVQGNLRVKGRAVFWDAAARDLEAGLRAYELLLPNITVGAASLRTPSGGLALPLNSPHFLRTTGLSHSGNASYDGTFDFLRTDINPANSYQSRLSPSHLNLNGFTPEIQGALPVMNPPTTLDSFLLEYLSTNSPSAVVTELSRHSNLSSAVLRAAIDKGLPSQGLYQIFSKQSKLPKDALEALLFALEEQTLEDIVDRDFLELYRSHGVSCSSSGKGTVLIYLDSLTNPHLHIKSARRVRLVGQRTSAASIAATSLDPALIIINNVSAFSDTGSHVTVDHIDLYAHNARPLVLFVASDDDTPALPRLRFMGGINNPSWRGVFDFQNTGLSFDLSQSSGATIRGGISTNHRIIVQPNILYVEKDPDAEVLSPLLSRNAWIEMTHQ